MLVDTLNFVKIKYNASQYHDCRSDDDHLFFLMLSIPPSSAVHVTEFSCLALTAIRQELFHVAVTHSLTRSGSINEYRIIV